jgi:hypothetical protein
MATAVRAGLWRRAMPIEYRVDKEQKTVFSRGFGVLTDDDFRGHRADLQNDPEVDESYKQLFDLSEVTRFEAALETLREIAQSAYWSEASKRVFVAPQDVVFGSARFFQAYDVAETVMVVRDLKEARRWLELD